MQNTLDTPWHRASFQRFLQSDLPETLAANIPLSGYEVQENDAYSCKVTVIVTHEDTDIRLEFSDIPQPDDEGIFHMNGQEIVVVPMATSEQLDQADVHCVGELLDEWVTQHISKAPADFVWTEELLSTWVPLQEWFRQFFEYYGQVLDTMNWVSRQTHLRRIIIPDWKHAWTPQHKGRACPVESPEGPNVGMVFTLARGAAIEDRKIVVKDASPAQLLGLSASMIPFLEHSDPARLLMGANMLRQWRQSLEFEPAIVQTGNEPDTPEFWSGVNLLTAFTSGGTHTYEDAFVLSESAARRFVYPDPVEVGDKFSNRHGQKGVISKILPDEQMPQLPDGRRVEMLVSFVGLHTRMNLGQLLEAVISWIGHLKNKPVIVPPWQAPSREDIQEQLKAKGLPADGMFGLRDGSTGDEYPYVTTVGWVYWGRLVHCVARKLHFCTTSGRCQVQGQWEYYALKQAGGFKNLQERITLSSIRNPQAETLPERIAQGQIDTEEHSSPYFTDLQKRLACAGIGMELQEKEVRFSKQSANGDVLRLAKPVSHPWQFGKTVTEVGRCEDLVSFAALEQANRKLTQMLATTTPESLIASARQQLGKQLATYFQELLQPRQLRIHERICFSGRTVITPADSLKLSQIGLPEEMIWHLYEPFVVSEIRDVEEVKQRSPKAVQALQAILDDSWVLVNRAPSMSPTAILAFHPVMVPEKVIRLHPLVCRWMNADFDGDQEAVFVPLTRAAQQEAGQKLSVKGHLQRDPGLLYTLLPNHESLVGLAHLCLSASSKQQLAELLDQPIEFDEDCLTQDRLFTFVQTYYQTHGIDKTLTLLERLEQEGQTEVARLGLSMNPFIGHTIDTPSPHGSAGLRSRDEIDRYCAQLLEFFESNREFNNPDFGPQLLTIKSGARGNIKHLVGLIGNRNVITEIPDEAGILRHGHIHGFTTDEMVMYSAQFRNTIVELIKESKRSQESIQVNNYSQGFHVFARAFRTGNPGVVFANAAEHGETDPLTDIDARLFVGLAVE